MAANTWQLLFFALVLIYAIHVYILSHEEEDEESGHGRKGSALSLRSSKPIIESGVKYDNIEGVVNGKPYVILNDNMDPQAADLALSRLDNVKEASARPQLVQAYGEKKASQLRFMHIPRTGVTFINTMVHFCCENVADIVIDARAKYDIQPWKLDPTCRRCLKQPITSNGEYWSYYPYIAEHDRGRAVALFRNPLARIASQIVEMRSLRGMMVSLGISKADAEVFTELTGNKFNETYSSFVAYLGAKGELTKVNRDAVHQQQYQDFLKVSEDCYNEIFTKKNRNMNLIEVCRWQMSARYPGIRGCQTRMVLGKNCIDSYQITQKDVELAKTRLKDDFAFIGKLIAIC